MEREAEKVAKREVEEIEMLRLVEMGTEIKEGKWKEKKRGRRKL